MSSPIPSSSQISSSSCSSNLLAEKFMSTLLKNFTQLQQSSSSSSAATTMPSSTTSPSSSSSPSFAASSCSVKVQPKPNGGIQNFRGINNMLGPTAAAEGLGLQKLFMNFAPQNHCQQNAYQNYLNWEEEEKQRRRQAMLFNKAISHEKRKITPPISDYMVREVLKRKNHLVEHNTSRDLKFSEEKRKAWETVRDLLKQKFAGFNMGIENIKSHWRYRKRKVSDAANEMRGPDAEEKLREKLGNDADFEIYLELKASNLLEHYDDDESEPMALSSSDEIVNAIFTNGGGNASTSTANSSPFSVLFDGADQGQNQQPQNGAMVAQNVTQLLQNAAVVGFPQSLLVALFGQRQSLLTANQQGEMTDSSANSNGNQPIAAGINGNEQLQGGEGRKRAADTDCGELFQLVNGDGPNGQCKARKEGNELLENGNSNEAGNIEEEMAMECSMNKKGKQLAESTSSIGANGMQDLWGQFNTLIQAQIAAAQSQKEAADLQKVAFAEFLQATKGINELLPKVDALMEKWMEDGSKN